MVLHHVNTHYILNFLTIMKHQKQIIFKNSEADLRLKYEESSKNHIRLKSKIFMKFLQKKPV